MGGAHQSTTYILVAYEISYVIVIYQLFMVHLWAVYCPSSLFHCEFTLRVVKLRLIRAFLTLDDGSASHVSRRDILRDHGFPRRRPVEAVGQLPLGHSPKMVRFHQEASDSKKLKDTPPRSNPWISGRPDCALNLMCCLGP